ncbi:DUF21-domain-containing protein [Lophium mytilinum]|uniref:DUF21-domain-containing protein n=1 Tax=Lophium mytilinum TaxID=390894 RepID=A0A6A6QR35_9PEZI|nr:DUF21-domain-containing protein [Lophium mytilinum]
MNSASGAASSRNVLASVRPAAFTTISLLFLVLAYLPLSHGAPVERTSVGLLEKDEPKPADDPSLWIYLGTAAILVLLGGAFAGLTIALMGQDEIYLQVIASSGEGSERKNAEKVLNLLKKGKHWVLVTLLLSNTITNETLPIVLDRSLGGGWPAVLGSTALIVIFGEVVPQSVCARYGLPIGAMLAPTIHVLMWIMSPIAWPIAKLLDYLLGKNHGATYKKAGLKTLVDLHKTLGTSPDDRLNQDEVTIISAVLDLKDKSVGSIMTPLNDVFTMSADTVLDEKMMDIILSAGYSRIPIYSPDNERNFVGMLLVKMLITYDPEDALRVRDFALATLPETRPETSCLDIVNFFQEGKSHMVLISDFPGESYGASGVVTLEDVIEELIGEEIIDESDVFIDVHKAIRRMAPAPRSRVPKGEVVADSAHSKDEPTSITTVPEDRAVDIAGADKPKPSMSEMAASPKVATFMIRRRSSGTGSMDRTNGTFPIRSTDPEFQKHLKHLGPSNVATRPKQTRINTVKIKPGVAPIPENAQKVHYSPNETQGGIGDGLLESAGRDASDGVHSLAVGYGTMSSGAPQSQTDGEDGPASQRPKTADSDAKIIIDNRRGRTNSTSTLGSLHSVGSSSPKAPKKRATARSGSITENFVDIGGIKKMVLETTSSSDTEEGNHSGDKSEDSKQNGADHTDADGAGDKAQSGGKKKRKKRAGKKRNKGGAGESAPLLGGDHH